MVRGRYKYRALGALIIVRIKFGVYYLQIVTFRFYTRKKMDVYCNDQLVHQSQERMIPSPISSSWMLLWAPRVTTYCIPEIGFTDPHESALNLQLQHRVDQKNTQHPIHSSSWDRSTILTPQLLYSNRCCGARTQAWPGSIVALEMQNFIT